MLYQKSALSYLADIMLHQKIRQFCTSVLKAHPEVIKHASNLVRLAYYKIGYN